mmetsp:Transcript_31192/g.63417  ORF Transcript_31192/g.63417 Transcript_31192/m.63417 type:complete len:451 (+) Transcript_31192:41-1393(+)
MTQDWKSRAETMLSRFINDDIDSDTFPSSSKFSPFSLDLAVENSSNSDASSACYDDAYYFGVYDRLRYGCKGCDTDGEFGQCVSLYLSWAKIAFARIIRAYVSSPLCLALAPLILGLLVGFLVGKRSNDSKICSSKLEKKESRIDEIWPRRKLAMGFSRFLGRITMPFRVFSSSSGPRAILTRKVNSDVDLFKDERDKSTRAELKGAVSVRESGVDLRRVPRHVAVIMDGNRRYGKAKYGNATRGHWDGSKTLIEFAKWCIAEGVQVLTVYAFSTENWDRDPSEVSALMSIFCKYCDELRVEAIKQGIQIHVLSTDDTRIPQEVMSGINQMVMETKRCNKFTMNICLSYGGRGEITNACRLIAKDVKEGNLDIDGVDEQALERRMLTGHCCDPDIIIRTSGEERLSNFLLWQAAYSEFFFLKKQWPELQKDDLIGVIRTYARGRKRRYGK